MKISEAMTAMQALWSIGKIPYLQGAAGIGKTSSFIQVTESMNRKSMLFDAGLRERPDLLGDAYREGNFTKYTMPGGLPHNVGHNVLFDDIPQADRDIMAALMPLAQFGIVGDYKLPDNCNIAFAGNRAIDKGVYHRLPDPFVNRIFVLDVDCDYEELKANAIKSGKRPEVIAFWKLSPDSIHNHLAERECLAFATPRAWFDVSDVLDLNLPTSIQAPMIIGRLGDAAGHAFNGFLKMWPDMQALENVLLNPQTAVVPTNGSVLVAYSEALAKAASLKTWPNLMTYAARMPSEFATLFVSSAIARNAALVNTHEYITWASKKGMTL